MAGTAYHRVIRSRRRLSRMASSSNFLWRTSVQAAWTTELKMKF